MGDLGGWPRGDDLRAVAVSVDAEDALLRFPRDAAGAVCVTVDGTLSYWRGAFPYDVADRLVVAADADVAYVQGGFAYDSSDRLIVTETGTFTDHNGVQLDAEGRLHVTGLGPTTMLLAAPFAGGGSAGNTPLNSTDGNRLVARFVARETGTLSKMHFKARAAGTDAAGYQAGTVANWSWQVQMHPVLANGDYDPATVLATETFNPNSRSADGQSVFVNLGVATVEDTEYALTFKNVATAPGTDWCSLNWLYSSTTASTGIEGANGRNERDPDATDAYLSLDPREVMGGASSDGATQWYPGTNKNTDLAKNLLTYIQEYADGTKVGQPYYSASVIAGGTPVEMNYTMNRDQAITHLGAFIYDADSFDATLLVNDVPSGTVTLTGDGITRVVRAALPAPVDVLMTDTVKVTATPNVTGSLRALYSDINFSTLMGNQAIGGPYWYTTTPVRVVPLWVLPYLPVEPPPPPPEGLGHVAQIAEQAGTTGTDPLVVTVDSDSTAGNRAVLCLGMRGSGSIINSVTDSKGNTWTVDKQRQDAPPNFSSAICSAHLTTALVAGDTITVDMAAVPAQHAVEVHEFEGIAATSAADQTAEATTGSGTSVSVGPTGVTAQADEVMVVMIVNGGPVPTWTPADGATQLTGSPASSGVSGSDKTITCFQKLLTTVAAHSFSASALASVGTQNLLVTYKAA